MAKKKEQPSQAPTTDTRTNGFVCRACEKNECRIRAEFPPMHYDGIRTDIVQVECTACNEIQLHRTETKESAA